MKQKLAVICGGTNTEHEVSLVSTKSIIKNLDENKYIVTKIKIEKNGSWKFNGKTSKTPPNWTKFDIVFPVLHGPYGEDGTIQGMLEMAHVPYIGNGVLASALCMDKVMQKDICRFYNIKTPNYFWLTSTDWSSNKTKLTDYINKKISYPLFVKPANQGSSIGISKVKSKGKLTSTIKKALKLDNKVIIEEAVPNAREIECSVLGNESPKASVLGEIIPSNEFYDYDAKYVDGKIKESIPADLSEKLTGRIRKTAIQAFQILGCSGLARIDFLVDGETNEYFLNELNAMPGFTSISMYPKLWGATGIGYRDLLDQLVELGLERHLDRSNLNLSYTTKRQ